MRSLAIVFLTTAVVLAAGQSIDECFEKDSISCVQRSLYAKAKALLYNDNVEIVSGVNLVRGADSQARSSRAGKAVIYDQEIDAATDVADRQNALENFVSSEAQNFLTGRSIKINFAPMLDNVATGLRSFVDSVPQEIRQAADEAVGVVEGRGKKKKLAGLLPLLFAAKAKFGALLTSGYFLTALIAKKAIFASIISIIISGIIGLKALWSKKGGYDITPYKSAWHDESSGGWSGPGGNGGWTVGGSSGWDNSGHAHSQAYSGYHH